jgi:hypothetical protein
VVVVLPNSGERHLNRAHFEDLFDAVAGAAALSDHKAEPFTGTQAGLTSNCSNGTDCWARKTWAVRRWMWCTITSWSSGGCQLISSSSSHHSTAIATAQAAFASAGSIQRAPMVSSLAVSLGAIGLDQRRPLASSLQAAYPTTRQLSPVTAALVL